MPPSLLVSHLTKQNKNPHLVGFEEEKGHLTSLKNLASLLLRLSWVWSRLEEFSGSTLEPKNHLSQKSTEKG